MSFRTLLAALAALIGLWRRTDDAPPVVNLLDDFEIDCGEGEPVYQKPSDAEIARLCVNVTPRVRALLRAEVWESWPEDWLAGSDGCEVGMVPFTEADWLGLIHERIPTQETATVQ
jgi:hypothetical protein